MLSKNILFKGAPLNEYHQGKVVVVKHIFMRMVIKLGLFVCEKVLTSSFRVSRIFKYSQFVIFCLFVNLLQEPCSYINS